MVRGGPVTRRAPVPSDQGRPRVVRSAQGPRSDTPGTTPSKRAERGVRISGGTAAPFHHGRDNFPSTCDNQEGSRSDLIQSAVHIDTWSRSSLRVKLRSAVGRLWTATLESSTKRSHDFVLITFALNSIPKRSLSLRITKLLPLNALGSSRNRSTEPGGLGRIDPSSTLKASRMVSDPTRVRLESLTYETRDITTMGKLVALRVFKTDDMVPGHVAVWLPEP